MSVLDLIFPKTCLECGLEGKYICQICLDKVPLISWHKSDTYSIWEYKGVIRKAILALKYKYSTEIAKELGKVSIEKVLIESLEPKKTVLVPIPIYWKKRNLRGFNQSEELGKILTNGLGWKFIPDLLLKNQPTKAQVELKGNERMVNLKGSFELNPDYKSLSLRSKTIVVFDDVYTTGSTLLEAKKLLRNLTSEQILGLTISK